MKLLGAFSTGRNGVRSFLDNDVARLMTANSGNWGVLAFPKDEPIIAVAVESDETPTIAEERDGSFLIINGRLYNAAELWGEEARTAEGGAEQLLAAYRKSGPDVFAKVDANASFVLWDARQRRLLLVRDRIGYGSAVYQTDSSGIRFASDIPTLLKLGGEKSIDLAALDFYLEAGYVPSPWTMVESIRRVPPAHFVRVDANDAVASQRYWHTTGRPRINLSESEVTVRLDELLTRAIRRQLAHDPDGTIGVLLSGGVDSKLLLAVLRERLGRNAEAFTFRYGDYNGELNEGSVAKACAEHFGVKHHEIEFGPQDIQNQMPNMLQAFGQPFSYGVHTFLLEDIRTAGIKDVLSGIGADGWFLGEAELNVLAYQRYPAIFKALGRLAFPILSSFGRWGPEGHHGFIANLAQRIHSLDRRAQHSLTHLVAGVQSTRFQRAHWYSDPERALSLYGTSNELFQEDLAAFKEETEPDKFRYMGFRYFGADQMLNWTRSAAKVHDLDIHVPYDDPELLAFVHRLPCDEMGKPELRRLAATIMPHEMAYEPKLAQGLPLREWTRGELRPFIQDNLSPTQLKNSGIFDPSAIAKLIELHMKGEHDLSWQLWGILSVVLWQNQIFAQGAKLQRGFQRGAAD